MYCVNLQDNRIVVSCNILNEGKIRFLSVTYDTGARYSCFRADLLSGALKETDCAHAETKYLTGFIGEEASLFYKYRVDKFAFGNIDLGEQSIWITFDDRVTANLVGYDIIRQISRVSIGLSDKENFFASCEELRDYILSLN